MLVKDVPDGFGKGHVGGFVPRRPTSSVRDIHEEFSIIRPGGGTGMITRFAVLPGTPFRQPLVNINVLTVCYILSWQRSPLLLVLLGYRAHFARERQQRRVARAIAESSDPPAGKLSLVNL